MIGPNKAIAAGSAGALATALIAILSAFNINVSPDLATAIVTIILTATTWFTPHGGTAALPPHEDPDPQP
jgi:hypothetical protein